MIRTRFKKVLLVAPEVFPDRLITGYKNVKHIQTLSSLFPSLFELNPNLVIFDYDYVGSDIEKILRRIKINKFYNKMKICCYKSTPDEKTDSLLRALGVDQLFYQADFAKPEKSKTLLNNFSAIDAAILKWGPSVSN